MSGPYAAAADLVAYWRTLSDAETARATVLLGAAGDLIDEQPGAADFVETALKWVSLDMVKRAMIGGGGITQGSQAMADMSASNTYFNPVGNLYLTSQELRRLIGPTPPTASIKPTNNSRVPTQAWNYQQSAQTNVSP